MKLIDTEELSLEDLPSDDADIHEIFRLALTFDGYAADGSFAACAEIANERVHDTIEHLRMCLFFEQRRWRHMGWDPSGEALEEIHELVAEMRRRLKQRSNVEEGA